MTSPANEDLMQYFCPKRGLHGTLGCFSERTEKLGMCGIVITYGRGDWRLFDYWRPLVGLPTAEAGPLADRIDGLIQSHRRIMGETT